MSNDAIVQHMITYIEKQEKDLQASILANENKSTRADIVNRILNELERELRNEDKEN